MQIDLRTVSIKPLRQTFDHVAARIGGDKPASRYQEGTLDLQADEQLPLPAHLGRRSTRSSTSAARR